VPVAAGRAWIGGDAPQNAARLEATTMVEPSRIGERAGELAAQAAQAAGPAIEKAKEVAGELVEKAAPLIEKAAPLVEKAGELAAHGVSAAAEQIDKVTGGKYADQISSVSSKLEDVLDPGKPAP
jgi:hypothetical protein